MISNIRPDLSSAFAEVNRTLRIGRELTDAVETAGRDQGYAPTVATDIDRRTTSLTTTLAMIASLVPNIEAAAGAGHLVTVRAEADEASIKITWAPNARASVEIDGPTRDLIAPDKAAALEGAATRGDATAAVDLLGASTGVIEVVVRTSVEGGHWVSTSSWVAERLVDGRWGSTLLRLCPAGSGTSVVVVGDGGDDLLQCGGVLFAGPATDPSRLPAATGPDHETLEAPYVSARSAESDRLPQPQDLRPLSADGGSLEVLRPILEATSRVCCWLWLAKSRTISVDTVTATFEGVRPIEIELRPYERSSSNDELTLFAWAAAAVDAVRDDAVQQAITLAIHTPSDLPGAAAAVYRTARSLYELASRDIVAQALAARRDARDAGIGAARTAAEGARQVAAKSVERALALLGAVALAAFAHEQDLLATSATIAIAITASFLSLLALGVADRIELMSGTRLLAAFDTDLELYREALSADDVKSIRDLKILAEARRDLERSRLFVRATYSCLAILLLVGGTVLTKSHKSPGPSNHAPTRTSTTPTPTLSAKAPTGQSGK